MYHHILVPLDGSTFGEHALPLALDLARKSGATLHLTHVLLPLGTAFADAPPFVSGAVEGELLAQQKAGQQAYLDEVVQRVAGVTRVQTALLTGNVTDAIRNRAIEVGADLIVMSTHGHGTLARLWLGSVADELIRGPLPAPLVMVRPGEGKADLKSVSALNRVLLALDGSPLAAQVVEPATHLAHTAGAELRLLRVIKPLTPVTVPVEGQTFGHMVQGLVSQAETLQAKIRTEAEDYLTGVAEPLRQRGLTIHTVVEAEESPATALLRHAQSVDLVALATHGNRGLFSRMIHGSVTDKVVRGAQVPVMVWHPKEMQKT